MNRLGWIKQELANLDEQGLLRTQVARGGPQSVTLSVDSSQLINFSSNDYLGLAAEVQLSRAVQAAIASEAWGAGASPLINGRSQKHVELEEKIASFENTQAAILFSSGYAANVGTISALVGAGDVIFSDQKNHASIVDGCRLSRAEVKIYPHADYAQLAQLLAEMDVSRRRLIVTDTLFSMDGDIVDLSALVELAKRFDAMLMIDEAHATGIFGDTGRGVAQHQGVEEEIDVRVGTLSKALGCSGGFVSGSQNLIDWLANRARSYVFSTAHPAATYAAGIESLQIVEQQPQRGAELLQRAAKLREQLQQQGWELGDSVSQIIPIYIRDAKLTMQLSAQLRKKGILVPGIRPPSVPADDSLLRISLSYSHTPQMIEKLVNTLAELKAVFKT